MLCMILTDYSALLLLNEHMPIFTITHMDMFLYFHVFWSGISHDCQLVNPWLERLAFASSKAFLLLRPPTDLPAILSQQEIVILFLLSKKIKNIKIVR